MCFPIHHVFELLPQMWHESLDFKRVLILYVHAMYVGGDDFARQMEQKKICEQRFVGLTS